MKPIAAVIALLVAPLALSACGTENQGVEKQRRIERRVGEDRNLGSADLAQATDAMVSSIAQVREIADSDGDVVIVMDTIQNRTSMPSQDYDIFLARLRALLNQSGVRQQLVFVETRNRAEQIKAREGYPVDQSSRNLPRYALTGVAYSMKRGASAYYLLTFQLVDLTNDIVTWEDRYEVKL